MLPNARQSAPRVLLVEDSPVNQKLLTGLLACRRFDVTIAANGEESVRKIEEEEQFDVVLMDVQMPVMDGLTATRLIREYEAGTTKHTLILAVTAGMDRDSCLDAGMDDYLTKPVRADVLYEKLDRLLGNDAA